MNQSASALAESAFNALWAKHSAALPSAALDALVANTRNISDSAHCATISGVLDSSRCRAIQVLSLCLARECAGKIQGKLAQHRDQADNHRFVDIWGRVLSCRALNVEIEELAAGQELDSRYAALNRGLRGALAALLLEAEGGKSDLGDSGALRWAYKLVAKELCTTESDAALLTVLP